MSETLADGTNMSCVGEDVRCGMRRTVQVYLLDNPFAIDKAYTYSVPAGMASAVCPGAFVTVPFGRGNRKQIALVISVSDAPLSVGLEPTGENSISNAKVIKPVAGICTERLFLSEEQLSLCFFLKEQTLCTMGEAVRTVVPASALAKLTEYYRFVTVPDASKASAAVAKLSAGDLLIYDYLCARGSVSLQTIKSRFGASAVQTMEKLLERELVVRELTLKQPTLPTERVYALTCSREAAEAILAGRSDAPLRLTSEKQKAALAALLSGGRMTEKELSAVSGAERAQFSSLVLKGLFSEDTVEVSRPSDGVNRVDGSGERTPHVLSEEQAEALNTLRTLADTGEAKAALLYGVTGSGKTCVILEMIDHMLDEGKGVILLLPEISLTPQMLSIFHARYGARVAVIHSGLSAGERQDSHLRISRGDATVVVGTRSAVFAPVKNLGMIVMDEEQEHTYKSDMNPKYHARDIARYRCATSKALLLLASATPSLESYRKAEEGKYTLIRMTRRYGNARLPEVSITDMRGESRTGNTSPLSASLSEELTRVLSEGNQSVLFLNRRGYSTQVVCRSCGKAVSCPNCSVAMNYHTRKGSYTEGELVCHWCGTRRKYPDTCPDCGSAHLTRMGYGTQRVEQDLETLLPSARIMRMDADTTSTKSAYHDLLGGFRNREADILLGTQMVTKGHDFPDVTLVGVLLADASLYLDDYRANERTFSMLTQVIGRAGRGDKAGLAVIQTMNPDSDVIKLACAQDYETFYAREIKLRKLLVFPPFCDIVLLTLTSPDEKELQKACLRLSEEVDTLCRTEYTDVPVISFGPFEAPVYRVDNVYRMRMVIKCRLNRRARAMFATLLTRFAAEGRSSRRPVLSVDFNPSSI